MKMRYSIEPKDRTYVTGYGFLSFARNVGESLSNKYGQILLESSEKFTTDAIKTASKRAIQKAAEATCDLIGNKIANQTTSVSKKSANRSRCRKSYSSQKIYITRRYTTNYWWKKGNMTI